MSAVHGTYAGYQRHHRLGQEPCADCRRASADYMRAYRRQKWDQPVVASIRREALMDALAAVKALNGQYPVVNGKPAYMRKAVEHDLMDAVLRQAIKAIEALVP